MIQEEAEGGTREVEDQEEVGTQEAVVTQREQKRLVCRHGTKRKGVYRMVAMSMMRTCHNGGMSLSFIRRDK